MTVTPMLQLTEVCCAVQDLFDARACVFAVVDGDELELVACSGPGAELLMGQRLDLGEGITGFVAQTGLPVEIPDVARDDRFAARLREVSYVPQMLIAAPLLADDGRVVGVLEVLDPSAEVAAEAQAVAGGMLPALSIVAGQVARLVGQTAPDSV